MFESCLRRPANLPHPYLSVQCQGRARRGGAPLRAENAQIHHAARAHTLRPKLRRSSHRVRQNRREGQLSRRPRPRPTHRQNN